jgi:aryl-alcohol dehydrogenase-like predicted oxidoreductase
MESLSLGRQGLVVSAQGLGCMGMSEFYAGRDDAEFATKLGNMRDETGTLLGVNIAKEKGCTPAQLALAGLHAQGADVVPIPGTKTRVRLEENLGALAVSLSASDLARIDTVPPKGIAAGPRYPEMAMKAIDA